MNVLTIATVISLGQVAPSPPPRHEPSCVPPAMTWAIGLTIRELKQRVQNERRWTISIGDAGRGYADLETEKCVVTFFVASEKPADEAIVVEVAGVKNNQPLEYPALADCYASVKRNPA